MKTLFQTAFSAWQSWAEFRERRHRFKNFTFGRQWDDPVTDTASERRMTEREAAMQTTGREPLTNNMIRRLVKTVIGRFRDSLAERRPAGATAGVYRLNRLDEIDSRLLEEFLISGCAVQRVVSECRRGNVIETFVDNVNPADFFVNEIRDPRGWDIQLVGMLHDVSLAEVIMRYGHGDRSRIARLRKLYDYDSDSSLAVVPVALSDSGRSDSFFVSAGGRCRVIEVWALECCESIRCHDTATGRFYISDVSQSAAIDREQARRRNTGSPALHTRREMTTRWRCHIFAPDGTEIDSYLSPYGHGEHPFVVKLYPLIDGEIHPFVEDIVDQQRQINRLITLTDHIMSASAKGVLLFPVRCKIDSMSWDELVSRWGKCGGVIPYHPQNGMPQPQQVTSSGLDSGASRMLEMQLEMMREVSGVSDALTGNGIPASVGADRYESQVRNAGIALADVIDTFSEFLSRRDEKIESV